MKAIKLDIELFGNDKRYREWSKKVIQRMLTALFEIDKDYLDAFPKTAPLYRSGVVYCRENGTENWKPIPQVIKDGYGDCEDLACYRASELVKRKGIQARPILKEQVRGSLLLYHVLVKLPDGTFEDPSRKLGMNDARVEGLCDRWV